MIHTARFDCAVCPRSFGQNWTPASFPAGAFLFGVFGCTVLAATRSRPRLGSTRWRKESTRGRPPARGTLQRAPRQGTGEKKPRRSGAKVIHAEYLRALSLPRRRGRAQGGWSPEDYEGGMTYAARATPIGTRSASTATAMISLVAWLTVRHRRLWSLRPWRATPSA